MRNRSVLALKAVGRKLQGLPPPELAKRKQIVPFTDEEMAPLLVQLLEKDEASSKKAQLRFGLRALPSLRKRLKKLGKDAPGRDMLDRLSRRLACTVVEVEFAQKSAKPDAPLAARLEALRGKPFDPDGFAAVVAAATSGHCRIPFCRRASW